MKTVILYYTFGGATQKEAERLAVELGAPSYRVKEARRRSLLGAFIPGALQGMHRKAPAILPLDVTLRDCDRIIIGSPVWGAYPAPAFNAMVGLLPPGKEVELFFCSAGGDPLKDEPGTRKLIEDKGCTVVSFRIVKTGALPSKLK
jgi:flavodoxin